MGGKTAMAAALLQPEAVGRLVVADIAPVPYQHDNPAIAQAMQAIPLTPSLTRAAADAALAAIVPDPAVRSFLLQNLVVRRNASLADRPGRDRGGHAATSRAGQELAGSLSGTDACSCPARARTTCARAPAAIRAMFPRPGSSA